MFDSLKSERRWRIEEKTIVFRVGNGFDDGGTGGGVAVDKGVVDVEDVRAIERRGEERQSMERGRGGGKERTKDCFIPGGSIEGIRGVEVEEGGAGKGESSYRDTRRG